MCGGRKFTEFQLDALEAHNDYRSRHGVPMMELNLALCDYSTEWANCLADSNTLRHNRESPYGENIFLKTSSRKIYPDPYEPVMQWYSEMRKNDFKPSPYPSNETKHFTQVIWKSSTTLGVGYATNKSGKKLYVVCNYHPAGNIYDEFMENVEPLKCLKPNCDPSINRNTINSRIRNEDRLTKSTSNLRHSTPSPICTKRSQYNEFELDCLRAHNEYRMRHGVSPLKLNKKLCRYAEEWAKIIASRGVLIHRNNSQYGENIFCSWSSISSNVSGREPVDNWYAEYINHVFNKEPTTLKSGHFTQVVWKESRELGIGMAKNRAGEVFVVAYYDPPGNYIGSFEKNVLPILDLIDNGKSFDDAQVLDNENLIPSHDEFDLAMLKMHNDYRRKHGAPELKLTKELMNDAQQWAETLAQDDRFTYRQNSQYGENLYCLWSSDSDATPNARDVCKSWYDEVKQYTWNIEPRGSFKAGQFTQMVWKSSKELGIGVGRTKNGKVIIVASYYPRGNIIGNFLNNVKRNN
ncbi:unnamed protein product [Diamesa serratosioi]